jgi:GNAT superfamily N-acetyltransferase
MEELAFKIRPLNEKELRLVDRHINFDWGQPGKHRERFVRQQNGEVTYLIAWHDDRPVGHALVEWAGATDEPMASVLEDCPAVEDLYVSPNYRSRGVGSLLLDAAEGLVRKLGYVQIGLGVGIDNPPARALYVRRGYKEVGFDTYVTGGHYIDREGQKQRWDEVCMYLIRRL